MSLKDKILSIFESRNLSELQSKNIPAPATMSGIAEASEIIVSAIESNKKIAIIGDYDVDGVSSSCIMEGFFKALGYHNFIIKIPNRFIDGYGISTRMVKIYNTDIYISVDNGITAFEVADFCAERGKILIITDHHKPLIENGAEILPKASVIINPNQRKCNFLQKEVCGAVVAWYLCAGIKCEFAKRGISRAKNIDLLAFTPFLSLAIISDIMPLTSLNRTLYKLGVKRINSEKNGVFALLREEFGERFKTNKIIDSQKLAFYITPLLNSAGRVKNARLAFKFLTAKNPKIALNLLQILRETNEWRKKLTNEVFAQSLECAVEREKIAYAIGQWNDGVIGIVAARIADKFGKSAFCFNLKNGKLKGSGRARDGVNLIASIQQCSAHLLRFGGHSGAVGLNLKSENLESFIDSLESNLIFSEKCAESAAISANLNEINMEILEILEAYEPYGNENAMICFESIAVVRDSQIIKDLHQKLSFKNATFRAILFNNTQDFVGQKVRIHYHIKRNFYNEIEAQIADIRQI
ncbi:single-stranded-DNA-specific exonuclease RecJ [Helicobacter sp. 23-1045]